ncbi:MAG: RpoL/Rpb11 RNA polymerase subunit family protein [Nanoarchaeota archaeon]|nr:RpoL/Rpb11 RNA polymerase subunit family protein [Nanoarchaeota archaeon]
MNIEITKQDKNEIELNIDNSTLAEIIRVYLNADDIDFAAWRKEHPTKPLLMKIQSSGKTVKKAVSDAVSAIKKDLDKISVDLKKK